uniref:Uncharacterized protein n=1 Tax=Arthrobotrys musiformis TaxID=47236 RepID=A0A482EAC4_9PEZI|nr:hypothetical protein [Arthrobotrys musiformis]QBM31494.1 hypothetical protein [Arthrobotrys musiformis]QBM31644.1 hypothetical protein [Arthrobotrys musiformis]
MTFVGSLGFSSALSQNKNSLSILNWNKKIITGLGQPIKKRKSFNTLSCFTYSTLSSGGTIPTKIYLDADLHRSNIIKENKKSLVFIVGLIQLMVNHILVVVLI